MKIKQQKLKKRIKKTVKKKKIAFIVKIAKVQETNQQIVIKKIFLTFEELIYKISSNQEGLQDLNQRHLYKLSDQIIQNSESKNINIPFPNNNFQSFQIQKFSSQDIIPQEMLQFAQNDSNLDTIVHLEGIPDIQSLTLERGSFQFKAK
eukprot:TRINITY_DN29993_c0_g1_i1.p3 TRINITY_DN29993_c0_g1~~TRINITY_DN29993_c0_g1_i1.p3  ORF type:complete len:149 (-),score=19.99 TRINITY_DN29993_c0_g1_i1:182-628(-)